MKERIIIRDARFYDNMRKRNNVEASALYKEVRAIFTREPGRLFGCNVEQIRIDIEPRTRISFFNKSI
jgi:hypothetical protein